MGNRSRPQDPDRGVGRDAAARGHSGETEPRSGSNPSPTASPFVQCEHTFNGTRCRLAAGHGDRHDSDSPVGGFYWFTEPPVPPPHGNTICTGCEACRIRAARGLPLYA